MDVVRLQDRISFGMGAAARRLGSACTVYRPSGSDQPLGEHNRVIELPVAFQPLGRGMTGGRAAVVWEATFDSRYTHEGDYLVAAGGKFFVAMQQPACPVRCVLTNRIITISRPAFAAQGGYNGLHSAGAIVILNNWPGYLDGGQGGAFSDHGPVVQTSRVLLLPRLPSAVEVADVITDDMGGSCTVVCAEQNAMGWRVLARAVTP